MQEEEARSAGNGRLVPAQGGQGLVAQDEAQLTDTESFVIQRQCGIQAVSVPAIGGGALHTHTGNILAWIHGNVRPNSYPCQLSVFCR